VRVIDDRGRLFGRVNTADAGAGLLAALLLVGLIAGVRIFRLPPAPAVTRVEPATQAGGSGLRLHLGGEHFLPYYRVFIRRSGETTQQVHEEDPDLHNDEYTLVNRSQAVFIAESPTVAEVRLPDKMTAGTYDLLFFNETQQVGAKEAAFSLTEPPPVPKPPPLPTIVVRATGAFTALDPADVGRFVPGLKLPAWEPAPWIELLTVEPPQPSVAAVLLPRGTVPATIDGKVDVPVTMRIRCSLLMGQCNVGVLNLAPNITVPIRILADRAVNLHIDDVTPDVPDRVAEADIDVRFVARPDMAAVMRVGQTDRIAPVRFGRPESPAVIAALGPQEFVSGRSRPSLSDFDPRSMEVSERVMTRHARLRVPVVDVRGVWMYRDQVIRAGTALSFSTDSYVVRGWILDMRIKSDRAR
jgi:hypothetical protein